jgi:hypothetical protein
MRVGTFLSLVTLVAYVSSLWKKEIQKKRRLGQNV